MTDSGESPDPSAVDDHTAEMAGKVTEALEYIEQARGHLYGFHQLIGHADALLGEAVAEMRDAGYTELADRIETEMVGRNVIEGAGPSRSSRNSTTATTPRSPTPRRGCVRN